jgi:hypothetical protein
MGITAIDVANLAHARRCAMQSRVPFTQAVLDAPLVQAVPVGERG